jgi:hypothetical protein
MADRRPGQSWRARVEPSGHRIVRDRRRKLRRDLPTSVLTRTIRGASRAARTGRPAQVAAPNRESLGVPSGVDPTDLRCPAFWQIRLILAQGSGSHPDLALQATEHDTDDPCRDRHERRTGLDGGRRRQGHALFRKRVCLHAGCGTSVPGLPEGSALEVVKAMGAGGMSGREVSRPCREADVQVNAFPTPSAGQSPTLTVSRFHLPEGAGRRITSRDVMVAAAVTEGGKPVVPGRRDRPLGGARPDRHPPWPRRVRPAQHEVSDWR